jgi:hypothetical protein
MLICTVLCVLTAAAAAALHAAGIAKAVGKALGKEPRIVLYSPEEVGTGKSGKAEGFPFRCA